MSQPANAAKRDAAATPVFHPVYSSVLATLPKDRPIPLTEILAAYNSHDRQLATALLVATEWNTVQTAMEILPFADLYQALHLLSAAEQDRIVNLLVEALRVACTRAELERFSVLTEIKHRAWSRLTPAEQVRIHRLMQGGKRS